MTNQAFVTTIDIALAKKLENDLQRQGFTITTPAYTIFAAKKKGVSCTLYRSGKLMVQGKEKNDFITFYLEPEILKEFTYTNPELYIDTQPHIGIDEAGKGDYFGPLCVAGVYADKKGISNLHKQGIADSKRISDENVKSLAQYIQQNFSFSLVKILPETYNRLYDKFGNLNTLLAWGHATAIEKLYKETHCADVTIDQFAHQSVVIKALSSKNLPLNLTQRHRGEEDLVVAAASIIARASFLTELDKLSENFRMQLPKGASRLVIEQGLHFIHKYGSNGLPKVAKMHFKTTQNILSLT